MLIKLIAVGDKLPTWASMAVEEYLQRINTPFQIKLIEVPLEKRTKNQSIQKTIERESKKLLEQAGNSFVVILDPTGKPYTSQTLAAELQQMISSHRSLSILIGGPDGFSPACLEHAHAHWSLSNFTLPHALARIVILEQIYRAQSILASHPYHR